MSVILIGLPAWYVVAILVTFSPEFGRAMGMPIPPDAGRAVMFTYLGLSIGGFLSGALSQWFRNRKRVTLAFMIAAALLIALHFVIGRLSVPVFYTMCFLIGVAVGYWAVFITMAAEQFGTNIRATVTTTAPNFVRGAVVPMTALFQYGRGYFGIVGSGAVIGCLSLGLALIALSNLDETYGRDLDFVER